MVNLSQKHFYPFDNKAWMIIPLPQDFCPFALFQCQCSVRHCTVCRLDSASNQIASSERCDSRGSTFSLKTFFFILIFHDFLISDLQVLLLFFLSRCKSTRRWRAWQMWWRLKRETSTMSFRKCQYKEIF